MRPWLVLVLLGCSEKPSVPEAPAPEPETSSSTDPSVPTEPPPATEDCRGGLDEDGDGAIDCDDPDCFTTCDADGDSYVDRSYQGTDCNDADPAIHPDAPEICDGIDNDCDVLVDDHDPDWDPATGVAQWIDADGDGYGGLAANTSCSLLPGHALVGGDCDDGAFEVNPLATEVCDGRDDDCDGLVDVDDPGLAAWSLIAFYPDVDGDGLGDPASVTLTCPANAGPGFVSNADDCDDTSAAIGAATDWYRDSDGDGFADGAPVEVGVCAPMDPTLLPTPAQFDCDDADPAIYPGAADTCGDGVDMDCSGSDSCVVATTDYDVAIHGTYDPGSFGLDLSVADVTGDGIDDLTAIGGYWNSYYGVGGLYVFPGPVAPGDLSDVDATFDLGATDCLTALMVGGDFTGDGLPDVLAGSPTAFTRGFVEVYASPVTASSLYGAGVAATLLGTFTEDLGEYVVGPTDLDGDGTDEVWIGAEGGDVVHALEGPFSGIVVASTATVGDVSSAAGASIDSARPAVDDFDGDGLSEVAFGAPLSDSVFVFRHLPAGVEGSAQADAAVTAEIPGDRLGEQVAAAGDVTGDGLPDLLVSALDASAGAGGVYVVAGPLASGSVAGAILRIDGVGTEGFGATLGAAGDLDGDGVLEATASPSFGDVSVMDLAARGIAGRDEVTRLTLTGTGWGELGYRVAGGGDLDGDGVGDLAVSSPFETSGYDMIGAAYVLFGGD